MKICILLCVAMILTIGIVSAAIPFVRLTSASNVSITNVNSSEYWDGLDDPTDISGSEFWYNQSSPYDAFNYNMTLDLIDTNESEVIGQMNASWLSTANETWDYNQSSPYDAFNYNCTLGTFDIYNETWSSTYNATYDANLDTNESEAIGQMNASWLIISNETTMIEDSNASWLSTSNETWDYNQSSPYDAFNYNCTLGTFDIYNETWSSTYNATYDANLDTNESEVIGQMNASWLSTSNETWDYNQSEPYDAFNYNMTDGFSNETTMIEDSNASWLSTYNATYAANEGNLSFNQTYADTRYISNNSAGWYLNITKLWTTMFHTLTSDFEWTVTDDGSDMFMDFSEIGGTNSLFIETAGTFLEIIANPGPSNDYEMFAFEETQGADTAINFYEGGTGHNRIWSSGSVRIGSDKSSLCSNITSDVDCDTSGTGADLVVEDDGWFGGKLFAYDWTNATITTSQIPDLAYSNETTIIEDSNASWLSTSNETWDYNQSEPYDTFNYNMTVGLTDTNESEAVGQMNASWLEISNETTIIEDSNASWLSTANETWDYNQSEPYDSFNYNFTTGTFDIYNETWSSTYNASYATNLGNLSWNKTEADTLYANIQWDYNQSEPYDAFNYNFTLGTFDIYNETWSSTYNATYAANEGNLSWNKTEADTLYATLQWDYNQSSPYDAFNYNMSTPVITIIEDSNATWLIISNETTIIEDSNASWLSTYNASYDANLDTNESEAIGQMNASWLEQSDETSIITDSNASWLSTSNETWDYNQSEPYDSFNYNFTTGTFDMYNDTWSSTYNASYASNEGNLSFNQTFADLRYANIQWDYNQSSPYDAFNYNMSSPVITIIEDSNATWLIISNETDMIEDSNASWLSTYNATYAANEGNLSWNKTEADTLYATIQWDYNQSSPYDAFNYNMSSPYDAFNYNMSSPVITMIEDSNSSWLSTYNATYAANEGNLSWNKTEADTLYAGIEWDYNMSSPYDAFNYNMSTPVITMIEDSNATWSIISNETTIIEDSNASWLSTYNATYAANEGNLSWNKTEADTLYATIQWDYNQSSPYDAFNYNMTDGFSNETTMIEDSNSTWSSTYNATYDIKADYNATSDLNMTDRNITGVNCIYFENGASWCVA